MVPVPAIMTLLGPGAWRLSTRLDSEVPRVDVDPQLETIPVVAPDATTRL